jgi:putative two-component system response regulator
VAVISRRIAERMGLSAQAIQRIYLTGLLHDVGKIGVPEAVLGKPGRLTDEEFEQIKQHPGIGARILGGIRQLDHVVVGIYTHHERLDGKGYPQGLRGDQVPQEGRIVGLADAFDAMTSQRPYRQSLPLETVLDELRRLSGAQFDPAAAEAFLSMDVEKLLEDLRRPDSTVFPAPAASEAFA